MELQQYARLLTRYWLVLLLALLLGAGAGAALTIVQPDQYRSSTVLGVVGEQGASTPGRAYQGQLLAQSAVATYARLATSREVLQQAADAVGDGLTPEKLAHQVSAEAPEGTALIELTVTDVEAERSQLIATQVGTALAAVAARLLPEGASGPSIVVVQPAVVPGAAVGDDLVLNTLLGAMLGLLLGAVLAAVHLYSRGSLHDRDDLDRLLTAPVLGEVRIEGSGSAVAARASDLRNAALLVLDRDATAPGPIVLAGITDRSEVSQVSVHLAELVAASGARVLLIGDDLPKAGFTGRMIPGTLADFEEDVPALEATKGGETENRPVGLQGGLTDSRRPALSGTSLRRALARVGSAFDIVIVAAPPLSSSLDGAVLGAAGSTMVLVVRDRGTSRRSLARALRALDTTSCEVQGVLVTRRSRS